MKSSSSSHSFEMSRKSTSAKATDERRKANQAEPHLIYLKLKWLNLNHFYWALFIFILNWDTTRTHAKPNRNLAEPNFDPDVRPSFVRKVTDSSLHSLVIDDSQLAVVLDASHVLLILRLFKWSVAKTCALCDVRDEEHDLLTNYRSIFFHVYIYIQGVSSNRRGVLEQRFL